MPTKFGCNWSSNATDTEGQFPEPPSNCNSVKMLLERVYVVVQNFWNVSKSLNDFYGHVWSILTCRKKIRKSSVAIWHSNTQRTEDNIEMMRRKEYSSKSVEQSFVVVVSDAATILDLTKHVAHCVPRHALSRPHPQRYQA